MKMWYCIFALIIVLLRIWFISYSTISDSDDLNISAAIEVNVLQNTGQIITDNGAKNTVFIRGRVKQHVPKFMLDLYEKSKNVKKDKLNNMAPDIVRSVIPLHGKSNYPYILHEEFKNDNHFLIFNVPNSNKDELFIKAELRVLTVIELKSKLDLGIERRIKISLYNDTTRKLQTLDEKHIYHSDNTWLSFNVTHAVQNVLVDSEEEDRVLKLVITIQSYLPFVNNDIGIFKLSLMPVTENFEHDYPILLLFYVSVKSEIATLQVTNRERDVNQSEFREIKRSRRHVDEDYEEETNKLWDDDTVSKSKAKKIKRMRNNCKRKLLYIDFAEIQYDSWIVQPSGYEAYQCAGKCFYPVAEHLSPTKHAIVQALLHTVAPSRAPRSCCVPTKLESISVLYVDEQGVLTYRYAYKDMVVTQCGCR